MLCQRLASDKINVLNKNYSHIFPLEKNAFSPMHPIKPTLGTNICKGSKNQVDLTSDSETLFLNLSKK